MSNVGQAALTIVGTAVGTYFGYPQLGFVLGSLAGNQIFPTKLPGTSGPRLQDQRTTTATVGAPVAKLIGTDAAAGNVIWMEVPAREVGTTEEVGGKGGPTQENTTYTYYQSIAIGICRGPKGGLRRIWENGKLVYDLREQQEGESDAAYAKRIEAATTYAQGFTLYLGTEDQMPDPTIELHKGVGNVPAYRGLCYIVFHDRQLQNEQGLRQPSYKFEMTDTYVGACTLEWSNDVATPDDAEPPVYTIGPPDPEDGWVAAPAHLYRVLQVFGENGRLDNSDEHPLSPVVPIGDEHFYDQAFWEAAYAAAVAAGTMDPGKGYGVDYPVEQTWAYVRGGTPGFEMTPSPMYPWLRSSLDPRHPLNEFRYAPLSDIGIGTTWYETLEQAKAAAADGFGNPVVPSIATGILGHNGHYAANYNVQPWIMLDHGAVDGVYPPEQRQGTIDYTIYSLFVNQYEATNTVVTEWDDVNVQLNHVVGSILDDHGQHHMILDRLSDPITQGWTAGVLVPGPYPTSGVTLGTGGTYFLPDGAVNAPENAFAWQCYDYPILCKRLLVAPPEPEDGPPWVADTTGRIWKAMANNSGSGTSFNGQVSTPLGPILPTGHPDYDNQAFWEAAYAAAVEAGEMQPGLTYNTHYPNTIQGSQGNEGAGIPYARVTCTGAGGTAGRVSIAEIIRQICAEALIGEDEIDVSDLEQDEVYGYNISRVMSARDAIEPLRMVGFFDVIESGEIIVFRKRGGAIDRTLEARDLGVHESGGQALPAVKTRKMDETTLPRRIFIHYRDPDRDYEDGEQQSPARSTAQTVHDVHLEVSIAMDGTTAKRCAEINWADAWEAATTHETQVGGDHSDIESGDVLEIPVDGFLERARVTEVDESLGILRRLLLTRDYDGSYVSVAVADPPERTPGEMVILGPSEILFLDIPALREEDNDVGMYATTRPVDPGDTWKGATIYLSTDEGVSFTPIAGTSTEPATGQVVSPLPAGATDTWDWTNTLRVNLQTGELETRTKAAVLSGANMAAIGVHGRWELIQFVRVTQVDEDTYDLEGLLRGRRGTAHLMGTSQPGDHFVVVSGAGIIRLALEADQRDVERLYKAVTFGMAYATGTDQEFASHGEALRPFSPVDVEVETDEEGNWTISWIRRDRLSQTLQGGALPLSDIPEAYEIDIERLGSPAVVERTITSSTTSAMYTAAQQADDFGEDTTSVRIRVHQINPTYGRGPGTEIIVGAQANENGLGALPFVAAYDDQPRLIGTTSDGFIFTRRGRKGEEEVVVGFYFWPAGQPASAIVQFDDNYDAIGSDFWPSSYFAGVIQPNSFSLGEGIPATGFAFDQSEFALYWRRNPGGAATAQKWLLAGYDDTELKIVPRSALPLSVNTHGITALLPMGGGVIYALAAQVSIAPTLKPDVYRSTDGGATWSFIGTTTGDIPNMEWLSGMRLFEHDGAVHLMTVFGNYRNAAGDLIDWDDQGASPTPALEAIRGADGFAAIVDFDWTATEIVAIGFSATSWTSGGGYVGQKQRIIRSTDGGTTWSVVREVAMEADLAPGFAYPIDWRQVRRFGTGYIVYGKALTAFAFPWALISTDGGATWGTAQAVDTGDPTGNAVIQAVLSDGTRILAIDSYATRRFDAQKEYLASADPTVYGRLSTSTDGLTFTALPGFPVE